MSPYTESTSAVQTDARPTRGLLVPLALGTGLLLNACGDTRVAPQFWFKVMMADATPVSRGPDGWVAEETSAVAEVGYARRAVRNAMRPVSDHCVVFEGIGRWTSERGLAAMTLESYKQRVWAAYDDDVQEYSLSGFAAGPAFGPSGGTFLVDDPEGQPRMGEIDAPDAVRDVGELLGTPRGLRTEYRAPHGEYDVVIITVFGTGPDGRDAGAVCRYRPRDAAQGGVYDSVRLVDDATIALLEARHIEPQSVSAGYFKEGVAHGFFGPLGGPRKRTFEKAALQAGRTLSLPFAALRDG